MKTISPTQLHGLYQRQGAVNLFDVRTPAEFRAVHVTYARNVPLESFDPAAVIQCCDGTPEQPIYVICHRGERGGKACDELLAAGWDQVVNVEGGTSAWEQAGLPVTRGKKALSLERQVRIAAGLLVLLGAGLGLFVHPYWIALAAFVGAGLTFAGITDKCGMAMVLAGMPWNQVATSTPVAGACCGGTASGSLA
jgi:rhodanese-related sulfurtransferase